MSPVRPGPRPRPLVQHVVDTANKITASGHSSFRSSHLPLVFFNFLIDTVMKYTIRSFGSFWSFRSFRSFGSFGSFG